MSNNIKDKKNLQIDLAKYLSEKDFVYGPEPELYSPIAGFYSYGLLGKTMKNNIEGLIRQKFNENNFYEVEYPLVSPEIIWKASGHTDSFNDAVVVCSKCNTAFRADKLIEEKLEVSADAFNDQKLLDTIKENNINCPNCKSRFVLEIKRNSLMMQTKIGLNNIAYNRPETATTTYLLFKHFVTFFRGKLPFTVFQIGKAFRNEISPRQHLLRQREFTQAEAQIFIAKEQKNNFKEFEEIRNEELPFWSEDQQQKELEPVMFSLQTAIDKKVLKNKAYAWAINLAYQLFLSFGIPREKIRLRQHWVTEKAFYADDAWDIEINLNSFGWTECCGIHDRGTYDLEQHAKHSKQELCVRTDSGEKIVPSVIEIAFGVDRPFYALLDLAFFRRDDAKRTVLSLPNNVAPIQLGLFPLLKKNGLPEKTLEVKKLLDKKFRVIYDESGSIGKRYSRLDAIGVPYCLTIDHQTMEDNTITIRERDSLKQERISINELQKILGKKVFLENE